MQILQQRFIRLIINRLGILFFTTLPTLAQESATYTDIFSLAYPDEDLSIKMLQLLFGQVGTALNVGSTAPAVNPVVTSLFYIFNLGVLTMVMLLVLYSMVYQAINVSQDGSQGMSKQSSAFLAFRIVLGSSLLLPTASSGYNGIQVIVMNIVVYGVAFANYAWTQAYQIAMGEIAPTTAVQQNNEAIKDDMFPYGLTNTWSSIPSPITWDSKTPRCSQPNTTSPYVTATDLWGMAVCTQIAAKSVTENNLISANTTMTATYGVARQVPGGAQPCDNTDTSNWFICFGNTNSSNGELATACGSIKFDEEVKYNAINNAVTSAMEAGSIAANQAWQGQYAGESGLTATGKTWYDCSSIQNIGQAPEWPNDWAGFSGTLCSNASVIMGIAMDYADGLIQQFPPDSSSSDGDSSDTNYQAGWATAGQYFQVLSRSLATGETASAGGGSTPQQQATAILSKRGIMPVYNFSPAAGTNDNQNTASNNSAPSTPSCTQQVLCFDVAGSENPSTLTYFYNAVLPSVLGSSATAAAQTWNYYSASATQPVASSAEASADESSDSGTSSSSVDNQTASVQNTAACTLAQNIINACNSLNSDMPAYLQSSNVMNPSNLNSITSGNTNSGSDKGVGYDGYSTTSITYQKTDFATTNMMLSVYMTIESLTGMKLFSSPITTTSTYKSTSSNSGSAAVCTQTAAEAYAKNCSENTTFLNDLFQNNLMVMGSNQSSADTTLAGLFGMTYIQEAGWSNYADPLANLTNLGVTMISAAVFYYTVTMQQLFEAILAISTAYTVYIALAKVLLAGLNALSGGMAEPLFVGTASLVEGFFQMLFALDKFALELFVPLGSAIAGILFTQGVVLGVFLPFLATIIYIFGVLGWLFAVLEAMVASSLVAMGLTHPEGHDLLGQSEQAMMLLLGVFVRPVAMILGLFSAMAVAKPTMDLVNTGFLFVTSDYFGTTMAGGGAGTNVGSVYGKVVAVSTLGLLLVYTYICYSILEMCYGLISGIPDRILRWIGGPEQQSQATQMAGKIKQDTQGAAQQGAQGASQTTRAPQVQPASSGVSVAGGAGKAEGGGGGGNIKGEEDK